MNTSISVSNIDAAKNEVRKWDWPTVTPRTVEPYIVGASSVLNEMENAEYGFHIGEKPLLKVYPIGWSDEPPIITIDLTEVLTEFLLRAPDENTRLEVSQFSSVLRRFADSFEQIAKDTSIDMDDDD